MTVPICRDCRWCQQPGDPKAHCSHEASTRDRINFVTGLPMPAAIYCYCMRGPAGPCGNEARLFEAREA